MQITQGLHRAVQIRGNEVATVFGERRRTWHELIDRVSRYAAGLKGLGVKPGDHVAVLSFNSDLVIESYFAIAWSGAVFVPQNFRWSSAEIIYALNDSEAIPSAQQRFSTSRRIAYKILPLVHHNFNGCR